MLRQTIQRWVAVIWYWSNKGMKNNYGTIRCNTFFRTHYRHNPIWTSPRWTRFRILGLSSPSYQSSLVLKQTVDDVNCIHLIAWKRTSTYVMNWFWTKNVSWITSCSVRQMDRKAGGQKGIQTSGGVVYVVTTLIFPENQRQYASFSINVAILSLSFKWATTVPNKLIDSQHYKRLRRITPTKFRVMNDNGT